VDADRKYFANQGEELMFESVNEVHDGYGKADPRHIEIVNDLDQAFVNLVRASGGNNGRRHLIVPGYNTNIDETLKGFKLPTDSAKNRLILSVHCYDPYLYALMGQTHTGVVLRRTGMIGVRRTTSCLSSTSSNRATSDQGVPVLIGEYGAVQQDGYEDYRRYYMEYVTKAAVDRGLVPCIGTMAIEEAKASHSSTAEQQRGSAESDGGNAESCHELVLAQGQLRCRRPRSDGRESHRR